MSNRSRGTVALLLALLIFLVDQGTKWYTTLHIPLINPYSLIYPYNGIPVFENFLGIEFSIGHVHNYGAAWGTFAEYQIALIYLRLLLIGGLFAYALLSAKAKAWWMPLALIIAGASSNVLDYFIYGHVVDMLHTVLWGYDFPVFNIADSSVFIGVAWICLGSLYLPQDLNEKTPVQRL